MKNLTRAAAVALAGAAALSGAAVMNAPTASAAAMRQTSIYLHNGTGCTLNLVESPLAHGGWYIDPLSSIGNTQDALFKAGSIGFMTGDEGHVTYRASDCEEGWRNGHTVYLYFDNPYAGSNAYAENGDGAFRFTRSGGSGDDAVVYWGAWKA
ncbi:hypothetical protein GCM10010430_34170 [Kitasatospora cystarginea]|uniref:Uncharacterized protein n=1 Tax=Kitasatospora cystarginea TaxID=58350 RepID=A0ABN3E616_9ACTN